MARQGQYINAQHNNFIQHATKTTKNNANYDEFTIHKNYMQNAAETRKLYYAKFNNYTQKIQIL